MLRAPNTSVAPLACIMDWDATSYTSTTPHCLRRADTDKHYPEYLGGGVHADGEIWSGALYDVWRAIGRTRTDTTVLEAQFLFRPNTTMPQAADAMVTVARNLYGVAVSGAVLDVFEARGILRPRTVASNCYAESMSTTIPQRDLRNDVADVLRRVAAGESFTVTVRGEPVAELVPIRGPRRFVPRRQVLDIIARSAADPGLAGELREMDVDDEDDR